jgi:hypothetical protein
MIGFYLMDALSIIAEEKIREAMARGEFDNLPGAGRPLPLDDDPMIPDELRVAYKILKNAGCIPPELSLRKEIVTLKDLLATIECDDRRRMTARELNYKILKLNMIGRRTFRLEDFPAYRDRIEEKLAR